MEEVGSNDRAYIKISLRMLARRNDLSTLQSIKAVAASLQQYYKTDLAKVRPDRKHSPGLEGISLIANLMSDTTKLEKMIQDISKELVELERLCEVYMAGGNILQAKLEQD